MFSSRYQNYYSSTPYYAPYQYQEPSSAHYYSYPQPQPSKSSKHKRRATTDNTYAYAPPNVPYYYSAPEDTKPRRSSSHRHREHVSSSDRHKSQPKRQSFVYTNGASGQYPYRSGDAHYSYPPQSAYYARPGGRADYGQEYTSAHDEKYRVSPEPLPRQSYSYPGAYADGYPYRSQNPPYATFEPETKPRARRASHSTQPKTYQSQPAPQTSSVRQATEADARKAGIPAGYSLKHWDPSEDPVLLLGSVFDANSLGKWIYDWTVACHGTNTPLTEVAGDLWLLLIQLAGKIKRAEVKLKRIRYKEDRELIEEFLDSGDRLWQRFSKLLKVSETYMLKVAKKKSSSSKKVVVGKDSGVQFVRCIFGRDHELDRTEKIMTGIRLWSMRFDANCDSILRHA